MSDSVPTALERLHGMAELKVFRLSYIDGQPQPLRLLRAFVRSPSFPTPTETWAWLFEQGVEHSNGRVHQGPDGWRGSGEVTHG